MKKLIPFIFILFFFGGFDVPTLSPLHILEGETVLGTFPKKVGVVGSGLGLSSVKDLISPALGTLSTPLFEEEALVKNISSVEIPAPRVVRISLLPLKYSSFALSSSIASAQSSLVTRSLPFVDRFSLSIFCSLASLSTTIDKSRCSYETILAQRTNTIITPAPIVAEATANGTTTTQEIFIPQVATPRTPSFATVTKPVYVTTYVTKYVEGVAGPKGDDGKDGRDGRDSSASQGGFGGFINPTISQPTPYQSQSLIGVSTIGYLRGTTIEYATYSYGSSTNMYLANANINSSVFNGVNTFNNTALFTGSAIINNLTATSSTLTNATTTNLFSTNLVVTNSTTTNAYIENLTASSSTLTNVVITNASTTNATTTNQFITNATILNASTTNSTTTNAYITNLINDNASTTNLYTVNASTTNSTTTNAFIYNLTTALSNFVSLFVTNATTTNFFATSSRLLSTDVTNASTTNSTTTLASFTTASTTNLFAFNASTTNLSSSGFFSTSAFIGGLTNTSATITNASTTNISALGATLGNTFIQGNVTLGTSTSHNITVNGLFSSHLVPASNITYDLGSPSFYYRTGYFDTLNVNTLSVGSTTISGTQNNSFTVNTDNGTSDAEDVSVIFFRGLVTPNAVIKWNITTKRFEFNQSARFQDETPSTGSTTLSVQSGAGQGTKNLLEFLDNSANKLSVFNASGYLGIGSSTPYHALTVLGNAYIGGNITATGTLTVSGQTTLANASTTNLSVSNNAYFAGSGIWNSSGNVGIGTTSPVGQLQIGSYSGGLNINSQGPETYNDIKLNGAYNTYLQILNQDAGQPKIISNALLHIISTTSYIDFATNNLERMRIDTSGSIGIGTTTPVAKLVINSTDSTTNLFQIATTTNQAIFNVLANGNVGIGTTTPTTKLDVNGSGRVRSNFTVDSATGDQVRFFGITQRAVGAAGNLGTELLGQVELYTYSSAVGDIGGLAIGNFDSVPITFSTGGTEKMRITGTGNVGIGTTSPETKLNIEGTGLTSITGTTDGIFRIQSDSTASRPYTAIDFGTRGTGVTSADWGTPLARISAQVDGSTGSYLHFGTSNSFSSGITNTSLTINPLGNVGIGTTTPYGNFVVFATTTGIGNILSASNGSGSRAVTVGRIDGGLSYNSDVNIYSDNLSTLNILAHTSTNFNSGLRKNGIGALSIFSGGGDVQQTRNWIELNAGSYVAFKTLATGAETGTEMMRLTQAGSLGIGTTTPTATLTVSSSSATASSRLFSIATSSEIMTVLANGNVGIGTTTPNNLLQVYDLVNFNNAEANTDLGYMAGKNKVSGALLNTFVGYESGKSSAVSSTNRADYNSAFGARALYSNAIGYENTAIGHQSLYSNTDGDRNTATGFNSMFFNTTGLQNTSNGASSLYSNTTGSNNTGIGFQALSSNTIGLYNTAVGGNSLVLNSTGAQNTATGYQSLYDLGTVQTAGAFNVGTIYTIVSVGTTDFTLIGASSNTVGVTFTATGAGTGTGTATAYQYGNTAIGYNTGRGIITGTNNTILGANVTGLSSTLSNNIIIADGSGNQRINVGSTGYVGIGTSTPTALLTVASSTATGTGRLFSIATSTEIFTVLANGNVGIGTSSPTTTFSVVGNGYFTGGLGVGVVNTSTGTLQTSGNVGIGTAAVSGVMMSFPSNNGVADDLLRSPAGNGNFGFRISRDAYAGTALKWYGSSNIVQNSIQESGSYLGVRGQTYFEIGGDNATAGTPVSVVGNYDTSQPVFTVGGVNNTIKFFTVTGTGNVGIGTTTPLHKLDVLGYINVDKNSGYKQDGNLILYASSTNFSTLVGSGAGPALLSDGLYNTALGYQALNVATSSGYNTAIGYQSLRLNTTGIENVSIGYQSLDANTTGFRNVGVGNATLGGNTTGESNTAVGWGTLSTNSTGSWNTALGYVALNGNTTGYENVAVGYYSLADNTTGNYNVATGNASSRRNTTGNNNTAFGHTALTSNTSGSDNTAIGFQSLYYNTSATSSTAIGYSAGRGNSSYRNQGGVYVGYQSGYSAATSSDYNTLVGYQSGYGVTTGARNVLIGQSTIAASYNQVTTGSNNIAIGNDVAVASSTASNQLNIGNLIYGTSLDGTGSTLSSGNIGIGTTTPMSKLHSTGTVTIGNEASTSTRGMLQLTTGGTSPISNRLIYGADGGWKFAISSNVGGVVTDVITTNSDNTITTSLKDLTLEGMPMYSISPNHYLNYAAAGWNLIFGASSSPLITFDTTGKVGIGTTTPGSKLDIVGTDPSINSVNQGNVHIQTSDSQAVDKGGSLTFGGQIGTGQIRNFGAIVGRKSNSTLNNQLGYLAFFTNNVDSDGLFAEKMRITSSGDVGIGTTTPLHKLDVLGYINVDKNSGYKQDGNTILFASSTNQGTFGGISAGSALLASGLHSTAFGYQSLMTATSSSYNTAFGSQVLKVNNTGGNNTGVGYASLTANTTASNNTGIGYGALFSTTVGGTNTAVGGSAMQNNITGTNNTALGYVALFSNTAGGSNVAVGVGALQQNQADYNTALGTSALGTNTTGIRNVAIGQSAALANNATNTVAIGYGAAYGLGGAYGNTGGTAIGYQSGINFANGSDYNTLLGFNSGYNITSGANNIIIGAASTAANDNLTTGSGNIKIGYNISFASSTKNNQLNIGNLIYGTDLDGTGSTLSSGNIGIGTTTPTARLTVSSSSATASSRLFSIATSSEIMTVLANGNVGIGNASPSKTLDVTGSANITSTTTIQGLTVGKGSGAVITNTALGINALYSNTTGGPYDVAIGYEAMFSNLIGDENVAVGYYALRTNTEGHKNVAIGSQALTANTARGNVGVGYLSLANNVATDYNTALGYRAGYNSGVSLTNNSNSVFIGADANSSVSGLSNSIAIGYQSQVTQSNQVVLGNSSITQTLLRGSVGIGTTTPTATLTIASSTVSGTERLFSIATSTEILTVLGNGNVGLGTASPANRLSVRNTAAPQASFYGYGSAGSADGNGKIFIGNTASGQAVIDFDGSTGATNWYFDSTFNNDASKIQFRTKTAGTAVNALTILGSGNVGIGTTTPNSRLDIWHSTSTSNVDIFRIGTDVGSTNNIKFRIDSDGDIFTDGGTTIGSPADVAESYSAVEAVDAGTVVAFASTTVAWSSTHGSDVSNSSSTDTYEISSVRKALDSYEAVGVVSTNPGLHLGADIQNGVPVALSGRVPVKVTTENGEIKKGDYLTVSRTMAGYAMKLTGEGKSIGRAISDYTNTNDKVMMLVENGYQRLDLAGKYASTSSMLTTGNLDLNANGVAITNIKSLASANGTWSIGEDGRITAKILCIEDVCIDKTTLTNILNSTGQTSVNLPGARAYAEETGQASTSTNASTNGSTTTETSTSTETVTGTSTDSTTVNETVSTETNVETTPETTESQVATPEIPVTDTTEVTNEGVSSGSTEEVVDIGAMYSEPVQ